MLEFLKKRAQKKDQEKLRRIETSLKQATMNMQEFDADEQNAEPRNIKKKNTVVRQIEIFPLHKIDDSPGQQIYLSGKEGSNANKRIFKSNFFYLTFRQRRIKLGK